MCVCRGRQANILIWVEQVCSSNKESSPGGAWVNWEVRVYTLTGQQTQRSYRFGPLTGNGPMILSGPIAKRITSHLQFAPCPFPKFIIQFETFPENLASAQGALTNYTRSLLVISALPNWCTRLNSAEWSLLSSKQHLCHCKLYN